MPQHDIVVIGGSAGALTALKTIVELLPVPIDASIFVVLHTRAESRGVLSDILGRGTNVPVALARDGDPIVRGHIYVAPPDYHMLLTPSGVRVTHGPRENGFRPAIDPLFRTAAHAFGPRVVGVVLSGALSDGTYGLSVIKNEGGVAIVQNPEDAVIDSMPRAAIASVDVDDVLPASAIASAIERLTHQPAINGEKTMARTGDLEPQLPSEETSVAKMKAHFGEPVPLTCPDCGGTLWEIDEERVVRYQCHVGHQFAPDVLENAQGDAVDSALWSAVRALEEQAELRGRLARRATDRGLSAVSQGFEDGARDAHAQAQQIRSVLFASGARNRRPRRAAAAAVSRRRARRKISRTKAMK